MDFSSHNPVTSNALNLAARNNDDTSVRRLLQKINPNCVDNRGWTCLHEAANSDSYESLVVILKHPDCRPLSETHEGHTALYLACRNHCSLQTIKVLLENVKAIVNRSSTEGVTPLHVVSAQGRVDIIQLLLDYGANIDVQDFDGDTPLHEACLAKQPEAIKVLLHAGANPQIRNEQLFTPFHIACSSSCLQALASVTNDVNQRIATGDTPLMIALRTYNEPIVYYLLDIGANPNLKNMEDKLALDVAIDIGFSSVFKKLLSVTDHDAINVNIVFRACKPHYFSFEILGALLTSDLGPKYFKFTEPCNTSLESISQFKPSYCTHSPLNTYLQICEYIYKMSPEKFREYFYLFLKRGVSVNASESTEFPPLVYIHYCAHTSCFEDVFEILIKHGCNVDYCSGPDKGQCITDAFLASITLDPSTAPLMIPYSLYCDPESIIEVARNNGLLDRMPLKVQRTLMSMIDGDCEAKLENVPFTVASLKHLCRLKVRDIIKAKDRIVKSTEQYLQILNDLPIPQILKPYLRFTG